MAVPAQIELSDTIDCVCRGVWHWPVSRCLPNVMIGICEWRALLNERYNLFKGRPFLLLLVGRPLPLRCPHLVVALFRVLYFSQSLAMRLK